MADHVNFVDFALFFDKFNKSNYFYLFCCVYIL